MSQEIKQNKMGVMPVGSLLVRMALPLMLSMLIQALYNIVDSIYVARISQDALTAVSLASPMQMIMISLCIGTSVGFNSLVSRSLGAREFERANIAAGNGLLLGCAAAAGTSAFSPQTQVLPVWARSISRW